MMEIYNHFVASYFPRYRNVSSDYSGTRNVYRNILSSSKKSPLCKFHLSQDKQMFALGIKDAALSLRDQLDYLADDKAGAFDAYKIVSGNEDVATGRLLDDNASNMPQEIYLKVESLATPQVNEGIPSAPNDIGALNGSYSFVIEVEGKSYEYQFQIAPESTNATILGKLSDFINKSRVEVTSHIERSNGEMRVLLTSKATGAIGEPLFHIYDSEKPGGFGVGIIEHYGLDQIAHESTSATLQVNGEPKETLGNTFTFNKNISITMHNTSEDPVMLKILPDKDVIKNRTSPLLNAFNSLIDLTNSVKGNSRSTKLRHDLNHVISSNYDDLVGAGIVSQSSDYLEFDNEALTRSISNKSLEGFFSKDGRFYKQLNDVSNNIIINPMDYIDRLVVTYPNTSVTGYNNPYSPSIFSGMLFNSYC